MTRKIVIFDLDGVIVDSERLHYEAYRQAFQIFHFDLSENMYKQHLWSRGRKAGLQSILNADDKLIDAIGKEKDSRYGKLIEDGKILIFDDAMRLIEDMKNRNIRMAIGTASKLGKMVIEKMGLSNYFEVIITFTDVKKNKTDPEIYLKTMEKLGVKKEDCYVIEDSNSGTIAGLDAGAEVLFIRREGAPSLSRELENNHRVHIYNSLEELIGKI